MTHTPETDRRTVLQGLAAAAAVTPFAALDAAPVPISFLAVGDWGRDGASHQRDVAAQMGHRAQVSGSRFVVSVGDNFYPTGVRSATDTQWLSSFEHVYTDPALQTPWYALLGNHDYKGVPDAQLAYAKTGKRWRMPARYYSTTTTAADGRRVDMFMLDTSPMVKRYRDGSEEAEVRANVDAQDPEAQLRWLETALKASPAPWKLVFGHHPVYSGGHHGSTPELVARVAPLLQRYGVQAYVHGHDHDLQHIVTGGVSYICTGAGSETRPVKKIAGTQFCSDRSGFTAYRIAGDTLAVDFIDYTGATLHSAVVPRVALARAA